MLDVWRTFDFMNHIPNMTAVFEEVSKSVKINEPSICFSTGPEHTNEFYVGKVKEILAVTGEEIILCIKNHGGLGTPKRIGDLVDAIKQAFPELVVHYHGHNTDGNDIGRITAAVLSGATIVDASDHAFTGLLRSPALADRHPDPEGLRQDRHRYQRGGNHRDLGYHARPADLLRRL